MRGVLCAVAMAFCATQACAGDPFKMPLGVPNPDPHAQDLPFSVDPHDFAKVESGYVCPEKLLSERDRILEIADFTASMRSFNLTIEQFAAARYRFLAEHHCVETLRHIRENARR